jgi:hypothetical protein
VSASAASGSDYHGYGDHDHGGYDHGGWRDPFGNYLAEEAC